MNRCIASRTALLVLGLLVARCDGGPAAPTQAPPSSSVASIAVTGLPEDFAVGETAQLRATARWSDGRTADVSATVRWSSGTLACVVTAAGLAAALRPGECVVSASGESVAARATTVIAPARRFSISGTIREQYVYHEPPIPGATITVTAGAPVGRSVASDASGRFQLADVPRGAVTLRVEADGFADQSITITPDNPNLDVYLAPIQEVLRWDGTAQQDVVGRQTIPFVVRHRGPASLSLLSSHGECGTYDTFYAWITGADGQRRAYAGPCRPRVMETVHFYLDPGSYTWTVVAFFPGVATRSAELRHPR